MDTFRSEVSYSSDAMGTSRLGSSSASLSFSLSSSRASSRSDLVSSFEDRFRERRAKAHKKQEREKKRIENNQRAESAEDNRRIERERAREIRKKEMENWLPTPLTLQQVERVSRQRNRARMREIRDWYPLPSDLNTSVLDTKHDEMRPVFGGQAPNCRAGTKQLEERAETKEKEMLAGSMKRRLAALTEKVAYLEDAAVPDAFTSALDRLRYTRAGQLHPLERITPPPQQPVNYQQLATARSLSALPDQRQSNRSSCSRARTTKKSTRQSVAPRDDDVIRGINRELERNAETQDNAEMRAFLDAHRRLARREKAAITLQARWRGFTRRRVFLRWSDRRWELRRDILSVWLMSYRVGKMAKRALVRTCLFRWRREITMLARLRDIELSLFAEAEGQPASANLPKLVVNLALADDKRASDSENDPDNENGDPAPDYPKNTKAASVESSNEPSVLGGLVNAAFLSVQQAAILDCAGRARLRRARHAEARANVRRKIAQRVFLTWKRAHATRRRVALNAQLCLKRAARIFMSSTSTASSRGVWPREKLLTVFDMWARFAVFARCRRTGSPLPMFSQPSSQWDVWLYNFQERQVRKVKAAARASVALQRRFLMRIRSFARYRLRKRHHLNLAIRKDRETLTCRVLREWRVAIADQAANKKRCRRALESLNAYARLKKKLRPLKQQVIVRTQQFEKKRAWRAWGGVHLRAVCKRDWNVARIQHCPDWRRRALQTLLVWRWSPTLQTTNNCNPSDPMESQDNVAQNVADQLISDGLRLRMWRVLTAWRYSRRKRALFLTLQFHCARLRRRRLLFAVLNAWKQHVWKFVDDGNDSDGIEDTATRHVAFLEDRLALDPWDAYRELSPMLPMLFFGYYSDAARIFGGVTTDSNAKSDVCQQRVYSVAEIRQFHRTIAGESISEVRNAVLRCKHLVNAVDPTTGNSALHVALHSDDNGRRLELAVFLLTEGASTLDRANRHGQTPRQLAADDPNVHKLFERGVYSYFEETASKQIHREDGDPGDYIVMWRVVALMLGELQREARVRADVRNEIWHSHLKEEHWLRQGRVQFPASSGFLPSILRCRAFLDGMRKRIHLSLNDSLDLTQGSLSECSQLSESFGELDPYARFLLSPLLDYEKPEAALIHSFAGVIFSLDIPLHEIQDEAFRLEDECSALEKELLTTWEQLQSAERNIQVEVATFDVAIPSVGTSVFPLLRYFKDQTEMEYAMKLTILMNTPIQSFQQEPSTPKDERFVEPRRRSTIRSGSMSVINTMNPLRDIEFLKSRAQRKLRKLEKKLNAFEDQLPVLEAAFRDTLIGENRKVRDISTARVKLEQARLSITGLLVKQKDLRRCLDHIERAATVIKKGQTLFDGTQSAKHADFDENINLARASEVQKCLANDLATLCQIFDSITEGSAKLDGLTPDTSDPDNPRKHANALLTTIPSLQKRATSVLRELFVTNLLRTCCCWLAENLAISENRADSNGSQSDIGIVCVATPIVPSVESSGAITIDSGVDLVAMRNVRRRRTSLTNTRRVLETFQRDGAAVEVMDRDVDRMKGTYVESASLLFKGERAARITQAKEVQRVMERVEATQMITNPLTGQPENPPIHTVDPMCSLAVVSQTIEKQKSDVHSKVQGRKREELKHAMILRQIERMAAKVRRRSLDGDHEEDADGEDESYDDDDELDESEQSMRVKTLPTIRGTPFPIGNFVFRSLDETEADEVAWCTGDANIKANHITHITNPDTIEAMWRRGARDSQDTPKLPPEITISHTAATINTTVEQAPATNSPKRVLSANRSVPHSDPKMRCICSRRLSVHGMAGFTSGFATDEILSRSKGVNSAARGQNERTLASNTAEYDDDNKPVDGSIPVPVDNEFKSPGNEDNSDEEIANFFVSDIGYNLEDGLFQDSIENTGEGLWSHRLESELTVNSTVDNSMPMEKPMPDYSSQFGLDFAGGDDSAELDAFLSSMRNQQMPIAIQNEMQWSSLNQQYHSDEDISSSNAVDVDPLTQFTGNPLIVWETKLTDMETQSKDAILVQKLGVHGGVSQRRMIEYNQHFVTTDPPIPLAPRLNENAPESFETSEVAESLQGKNDTKQLSLMGKSVKMTGRTHRLELVRNALSVSALATNAARVCNTQWPTERMCVEGSSSSDNDFIPAISISVATKAAIVESVMPAPNAPNSVLGASVRDHASNQANGEQKSNYVVDSDAVSPADMVEAVALHVTGVNGKANGRLDHEFHPKRTTKAPSSQKPGKPKRDSTEKEGLPRARAKKGKLTPTSGADLLLQGSNVAAKYQPAQEMDAKPTLTDAQKNVVWKQFVDTPMSGAIQNAYAELYPKTYSRTAPSTTSTWPMLAGVGESPLASAVSASSSAPAGRLSAPPPAKRVLSPEDELELNKRFWREVEGYRAIGSSAMIPLSDDTIQQRRQAKARSIYTAFIAPAGSESAPELKLDRCQPQRLGWLDMYTADVSAVRRRLRAAPVDLFDSLQQTAQLRISTALATAAE